MYSRKRSGRKSKRQRIGSYDLLCPKETSVHKKKIQFVLGKLPMKKYFEKYNIYILDHSCSFKLLFQRTQIILLFGEGG